MPTQLDESVLVQLLQDRPLHDPMRIPALVAAYKKRTGSTLTPSQCVAAVVEHPRLGVVRMGKRLLTYASYRGGLSDPTVPHPSEVVEFVRRKQTQDRGVSIAQVVAGFESLRISTMDTADHRRALRVAIVAAVRHSSNLEWESRGSASLLRYRTDEELAALETARMLADKKLQALRLLWDGAEPAGAERALWVPLSGTGLAFKVLVVPNDLSPTIVVTPYGYKRQLGAPKPADFAVRPDVWALSSLRRSFAKTSYAIRYMEAVQRFNQSLVDSGLELGE